MTHKIAVIGAGIIGTCAARALQREGADVTIYDPAAPGSGCSFGNAGNIAIDHVRPLTRWDVLRGVPGMLADPLAPLSIKPGGLPKLLPWAWRALFAARPSQVRAGTLALGQLLGRARDAWAAEIQYSRLADLFRFQGALVLYERAETFAAAAGDAAILEAHGVRLQLLSLAETNDRVPGLARPAAGGRFYPDAMHTVDPHALVLRLAERFISEGGRIERRHVTGFVRRDGIVSALETEAGSEPVDAIVLATGLGSAGLARQLGARVPITGERGYHVMLAGGPPLDLSVTFAERGFIATPMAGGLRLAGTVELGAGAAPDWRRADALVKHLADLFDQEPPTETSRWTGDRPTLPDYLPMLGPSPAASNAFFAFGHQHVGLTLAAITGRLITDFVLGRPCDLDLHASRTDRFGRV